MFSISTTLLVCLVLNIIGRVNGCNEAALFDELPMLGLRGSNYSSYYYHHSDQFLQSKWYTTRGSDGLYQMADSNTQIQPELCGTNYPLYYNGTHPAYATIGNAAISGKACLVTYSGTTDCTYDVKVRKCQGDLQYFLDQTPALSAYCFDLIIPVDLDPAPDSALPKKVDVKVNLVYVEEPIGKFFKPELRFKCSFTAQMQNVYYIAYWYINGDYISKVTISNNTADLYLSEQTLLDLNFKLGITIGCAIRVAQSRDGALTDIVRSQIDFFAGIKVLKRSIVMRKEAIEDIEFEVTVPIGCIHFNKKRPCTHDIHMLDANATGAYKDCRSVMAVQSKYTDCGYPMKGTLQPTDDSWIGQTFKMKMKNTHNTYNDMGTFVLQMKTHSLGGSHAIWQNYIVDYVNVIVHDDNDWHFKECSSRVDPHMTSGDQLYYEHQKDVGVFILYRNKDYKIEVHERLMPCNNDRAKCACAVAVRAGGDIFTVDLCNGKAVNEFLSCEQDILEVRYIAEQEMYLVNTPIGTYVKIKMKPLSGYEKFLNIYVYMSPRDLGKADGLCGYFDGDNRNDLTGSTGTRYHPHPYPDQFCKSWKFGGGILNENGVALQESDSYLRNGPIVQSPYHYGNEFMFCACSANAVVCSIDESNLCKKNTIIENGIARICNIGKKRSVSSHHKEIQRRLSSNKLHQVIMKRSTNESITTDYTQEAYDKCYTAIMTSYLATEDGRMSESKLNNSIFSCAYDITVTGDDRFIEVHKDSNNMVMQSFNKFDVEYVANNPEKIMQFENQACIGDCNGNGVCDLGVCICHNGYGGADCSIDSTVGPSIDDIEHGGYCDLAEEAECRCFNIQTRNLMARFSCQITIQKINTDTTLSKTESKVSGELVDLFNGVCCVPDSMMSTGENTRHMFVTRYIMAISNDGEHFGSGVSVYAFDSTCQEYDDKDTFTLKSGYCFIDGGCVPESATSGDCNTNACVPMTSVYEWTIGDCSQKDEGDVINITALIIACSVSTAVILLIIVIVLYIKFKVPAKRSVDPNIMPDFTNTFSSGMDNARKKF